MQPSALQPRGNETEPGMRGHLFHRSENLVATADRGTIHIRFQTALLLDHRFSIAWELQQVYEHTRPKMDWVVDVSALREMHLHLGVLLAQFSGKLEAQDGQLTLVGIDPDLIIRECAGRDTEGVSGDKSVTSSVVPRESPVDEGSSCITIRFPSDRALLNAVIAVSGMFLGGQGSMPTDSDLVLRELLLNAIVHGNGCDPSKHVTCQLRRSPDGAFAIRVKDEGQGFDPELLDLSLPDDPKRFLKRGLIVVNAVCKRIDFDLGGRQITACL